MITDDARQGSLGASSGKLVPGLIGLGLATNMVYYEVMATVGRTYSGYHSRSLLDTIDFLEASDALASQDMDRFTGLMVDSAARLQAGGANFLVITSNTSHFAVPAIRDSVDLPILDLRDTLTTELTQRGAQRVGILSTIATKHHRLFDDSLAQAGFTVVHPEEQSAAAVNRAIFDELLHGQTSEKSVAALATARDELRADGCDVVVLACTDMTLAYPELQADDVIDTTRIHAVAAASVAAGRQQLASGTL